MLLLIPYLLLMSISIPNQVIRWHVNQTDFVSFETKLDLSNDNFTISKLIRTSL